MPERPVLTVPNRTLKAEAAPTKGPDPALAADLADTMYASPGWMGLAAPQLGDSRRALCVDVTTHPDATDSHGLITLFDPELMFCEDMEIRREACPSVPGYYVDVRRPRYVVVRGTDLDGGERVIHAQGVEARAFLHELDHLEGLLVLDRITSVRTDVFRRRTYQKRPG